jgi:hypothetical protein
MFQYQKLMIKPDSTWRTTVLSLTFQLVFPAPILTLSGNGESVRIVLQAWQDLSVHEPGAARRNAGPPGGPQLPQV